MTSSTTVMDLLERNLRRPVTLVPDGSGGWTPTFEPPLTGPEQTALADLQLMAKFGITNDISLAEFQAIKPNLAELKPGSALELAIVALRTRTDAQWNALTAAQRQADQITWFRDLTDAVADLRAVLGALLRS